MAESKLGRDWTKGSIWRNLLSLAWPVIVSSVFNMAGSTIDMVWVGRLGAASIAGVGVASMAVQLLTNLESGIVTGARAMIARFWGAGDINGANHVARHTFFIVSVYSIFIAVLGIFLTKQILGLFGLEADVIAAGAAYMRIMFVGAAARAFFMMNEGIMQASGDTQTPMRIMVSLRLFHIVLCPFFIFGWWVFPRLGVSGAAVTNVISQSLGLALSMWILFSGRTRLRLSLSNFRFDPNTIWRMVKIGIPASLTSIQYQFGGLVLMRILAAFGTIAVAAHSVVQTVEPILHMPSGGFGTASGVIAGQNLGARQPEQAERTAWIGLGLVQAIMLIAGVVTLLWAENIIGIFSSNPDVVEIGSTFLKIAIIGFFVMGVCSVLYQCLTHVGDTIPPLVTFIVAVWLVELPMAYFLPKVTNLGVYAIRWAMVAHLAVAAAAYIVYWRGGRWKHRQV